jgi:hypothetical protein
MPRDRKPVDGRTGEKEITMRSTLKIKTRLMLTAAAVAGLMATGAAAALWSVHETQQHLGAVLRDDARTAAAAAQFTRRVSELGQQGQVALAAGPSAGQPQLGGWNAAYAAAGAALAELDATPAGHETADPLRVSLAEYQRQVGAAATRIAAGGAVTGDPRTPALEAFGQLDRQSAEIASHAADQLRDATAGFDGAFAAAALRIFVVLGVGLLLLAVLLARFLARPVAVEVGVLRDVCAALERGDLSSRPTSTSISSMNGAKR